MVLAHRLHEARLKLELLAEDQAAPRSLEQDHNHQHQRRRVQCCGLVYIGGEAVVVQLTLREVAGATRSGQRARYMWAQLLARIYGVFALQCSRCGGRVHLVGFITEPATVRQILEHVGERTTAPRIALARSPRFALNGQQLAAPEWEFEAIPELEFDQTANLAAEAGHDQWTHPAGAGAEPNPDLEFDQTLGWWRRAGSGWCFARSLPPPAGAQSRDFWLCRSVGGPSAILHAAQRPLNAGVPSCCAHRPWLFPPNPRSTLLTGTRSHTALTLP